MEKISVIVPVFKVEKYLCRCIDSILSQTFTDFELILIDDGSPDNCGKICDEYAKKDSRIHVIHKENGGLSSARNAGLDVANGDYVVFIDSDDYIEPDLFQEGIVALKDFPKALVNYGFYVENDQGINKSTFILQLPNTIFLNDEHEKTKLICNELTDYKIPWSAWSKFYSRDVIEKNDLRFEDNKRIFAEDLYFSLCFFSLVDHVVNIQKPLYHYIERSDSIMGIDRKQTNTRRFERLAESVRDYYTSNINSRFMLEYYAVLYYKIIDIVIRNDLSALSIDDYLLSETIVKTEIQNYKQLTRYLKKAWKQRSILHNDYMPKYIHEERMCALLYICNGNRFLYNLRNKIK